MSVLCFLWNFSKDLVQVLYYVYLYLALCAVFQYHHQVFVHPPSLYGEVCVLAVMVATLDDNFFEHVDLHVGYF